MSQINVDTLVDEAGTGPVNFPYDFTIAGSALVIPPAHNPVSVSGATQALDVGSYNFFNAGTLSADTTISFTSVPTDALWTYTAKAGYTAAYTVEAANYTGHSVSVYAQATSPQGVTFSSDGTKMYIIGYSTIAVYQYTLATAWDVSTATYASISKSVSANANNVRDLAFSSDGTKMYITDDFNVEIHQYNLATAWNVSTATHAYAFNVAPTAPDPFGLTFSYDGTKMYVASGNSIYQYTLGTAWSLSTTTYASLSKAVNAQEPNPNALVFKPDGTKMFIVGTSAKEIFQYTLGTAWNVSTATYDSINFIVNTAPVTGANTLTGLAINSDGTKIYASDASTDKVYEFNSVIGTTLTVPAAVQNPPTTTFYYTDQVSYTFVTNDGGTTVKLINETVL